MEGLKRYPRTKPAAITWIGEVPEHWEVVQLKRLGSIKYGLSLPPREMENGTRIVRATDVFRGKIRAEHLVRVDPTDILSGKDLVLEDRDIIVVRSGAYTGDSALVPPASVGSLAGYDMVLRVTNAHPAYVAYCLLSKPVLDDQLLLLRLRAAQPPLNAEELGGVLTAMPPVEEQTHVARYLDHKTALIDAFLARKRRMIALLKEHRQALISHAVPKGLASLAPMKDSGIEWIGEVPEHWSVPRIGHQCRIVRGSTPRPAGGPRYFNGTDMPWITVGEVTRAQGKYIESTEVFLTAEGVQYSRIVEPETLLLSNSGATLGVPRITRIQGCINDGSVAFLDLNNGLLRDYLYYFFESHTSIYRSETQGWGQPDLNTDIIGGTCIALPPNSEQGAIIAHLDTKTSEIEEGLTRIEASRERMREYRQALISAVVSWKVDVTAAAKALAAEVGVQLADELMGQIVGGALV